MNLDQEKHGNQNIYKCASEKFDGFHKKQMHP
jgi:hypothetical protein